jgi:tRNA-dihydrouridine synthase B
MADISYPLQPQEEGKFAPANPMQERLSTLLNCPLTIGNRRIEKRLVLSPMTQLGHVAFRELLSDLGGCGLMFSEMCNAKTIPHENRSTSAYFKWRNEELENLVWQIVGADPAAMAAAARRIEKEGFFGVDINFGCAAAVICRQHQGAALLKDTGQALRIVRAVREAVSMPLFVKFRTGWKDDPAAAVDLAQRFQEAGADALTFHPRLAPDRRSRPPKWPYIALVKQAVSIPVFGNGNVFSPADCLRMFQDTGCDAVAVGRMAIAQPWLFAAWTDALQPRADIYQTVALKMASLLAKHFDPVLAWRRFKRFALYYAANFRFGHSFYTRIARVQQLSAVKDVISEFFSTPPELTTRPNLNFMV